MHVFIDKYGFGKEQARYDGHNNVYTHLHIYAYGIYTVPAHHSKDIRMKKASNQVNSPTSLWWSAGNLNVKLHRHVMLSMYICLCAYVSAC